MSTPPTTDIRSQLNPGGAAPSNSVVTSIQFARTPVEELEAVEPKISAAGNEQYAAWREAPD
jgi:hypothetical protein